MTSVLNGVWTTKNGQRIPINLMTDNHLINAYRQLRRRQQDQYEETLSLIAGWSNMSDGARDHYDNLSVASELTDNALRLAAEELKTEIIRRGLHENDALF